MMMAIVIVAADPAMRPIYLCMGYPCVDLERDQRMRPSSFELYGLCALALGFGVMRTEHGPATANEHTHRKKREKNRRKKMMAGKTMKNRLESQMRQLSDKQKHFVHEKI